MRYGIKRKREMREFTSELKINEYAIKQSVNIVDYFSGMRNVYVYIRIRNIKILKEKILILVISIFR